MYLINLAIRRLKKNKVHTSINIIGLSISLMVSIIILSYTSYHFSFDKYVDDYENSYRVITRLGEGSYNANTFACFEDYIQNAKEVKQATTCYTQNNISEVFTENNVTEIHDVVFADHTFPEFFGAKMIQGDINKIDEPDIVFITPKFAKKLFGDENAIGKSIRTRSFTADKNEKIDFTVGGIIEALPETSHIKYEMLISKKGHFSSSVKGRKSGKVFGAAIYVKLLPNINTASIIKELNDVVKPILGQTPGPPISAFNYKLQSLTDIHFTSGIVSELNPTVRRSSLYILLIVGVLIFSMSIINFVNIFTARAAFRGKEFGIIRFLGGRKSNLWQKLIYEVSIMLGLSYALTLIGLLLTNHFLIPLFIQHWTISFSSGKFWMNSIGLFTLSIIIITLILTVSVTRIKRAGSRNFSFQKNKIIKSLVVFQFVLVISLISFTILLNKQLQYINTKDLGYNAENVMIINSPQKNNQVNICVDELNNIPGILNAGAAQHYPGYRLQDMTFSNNDNIYPFKFGIARIGAIRTLDIEITHNFTPNDTNTIHGGWLINETFYKNLLQKYSKDEIAVGNFPQDGKDDNTVDNRVPFYIIGVFKDFNYASLHEPIGNFAWLLQGNVNSGNRFMLVRYQQKNFATVFPEIKKTVAKIFPDKPFEYSFLYDHIQEQYESETILMKLVNIFSILCILVSCLGLIGVTLILHQSRVKEIGVRKVNGAQVSEIVGMLNKVYVKWIVVAFVIATPLTWYATHKWLENFAFKTSLSWWIFVLGGFIALGIALLTISWQSWRAASRNPVEALRNE